MDQSELNAAVQKWLESLLHPVENQESVGPLSVQAGTQELTVVLEKLRQLMKLKEVPKTSLRAGGTHLAILGRSVAAYLYVALESSDLDRASLSLNQQTTKAIMAIFKFTGRKLTPLYHDDSKDGLCRVAQMALFAKYDKYATRGASEFYVKPPVIYISDSGHVADGYNVCAKLGMPLNACSLIPCVGELKAMDVTALEKAIEKDLADGRNPTMVIAYAGTPLTGHVEDLGAIRELCNKHKIWMHVQGHALSSLCLPTEEPVVMHARDADSITLSPGIWFGLLSCPYVTLHRTPYIVETDQLDTDEFPPKDLPLQEGCIPVTRVSWNAMLPFGISRLLPLSLWLSLQYLGTNTLIETVSYCNSLTRHMIDKLDEIPGIKRFDVPNHQSFTVLFKYFGGGEVEFTPLTNTAEREEEEITIDRTSNEEETTEDEPTDSQQPTNTTATTTTIESTPSQPVADEQQLTEPQQQSSDSTDGDVPQVPTVIIVEELAPATANVVNALIARDLHAHFPKVGIAPIKLPHQGICFKFDPINSFPEHSTSIEDVDKFVAILKDRVESLHKTALARRLLENQLKGQPNIRCLEFPSFFGSGFIQFVPTDWASRTDLTLEEVSELNALNIELSAVLAKKNPAFQPFQHGNFSCIMIKELMPHVDLQEFVLLLLEETKNFEENKKYIKGISEQIVKGIEAAKTDLTKEKEKKDQEEGYLRYVPLVGSVLNWFSPSSPTTPEGRTFNLTSGKVETTATTYKFKMQVHDESSLDTSNSSQQTVPHEGNNLQEESVPPKEPPEIDMTETEEVEKSFVATENGEEVKTEEGATVD